MIVIAKKDLGYRRMTVLTGDTFDMEDRFVEGAVKDGLVELPPLPKEPVVELPAAVQAKRTEESSAEPPAENTPTEIEAVLGVSAVVAELLAAGGYTTVESLKGMSAEELVSFTGISKKDAKAILSNLK